MRIALLVESDTERAFLPSLRRFLANRVAGRMPRLDPVPFDGPLPQGDRLKRRVDRLLAGPSAADYVIALTDVHTGRREFQDAADAKQKMAIWVGQNDRFYAHAAQFEFEAWLLPYWREVQQLAGSNRAQPKGQPEDVNHDVPPSHVLQEVFRTGSKRRAYIKPRDAARILADNDILISAQACPELKALLNTILSVCGGPLI